MAYTDELCAPYERKRLETGVVQHMSTNTGRGTDASSDVFLNNHLITPGYITFGSTTGCTITEKAPTRAFSWLKAPTSAFTLKTLLRHYAKRALTPRSLNVKLGPRRKGHKGRAGWLA